MEYLVTMTTQVPDGVTAREVDHVRAREAAHTRVLVDQGRLLRLWRPPLRPGEWRTLGLFDADDDAGLEVVLASMPLRVWRTDEVVPMQPQANDPGRDVVPIDAEAIDFLTTFEVRVPVHTSAAAEAAARRREAQVTAALQAGGHLVRLWSLPGENRNLGHWQATDADQLAEILALLPMAPWLKIDTVQLSRHPNDPGRPVVPSEEPVNMTPGLGGQSADRRTASAT